MARPRARKYINGKLNFESEAAIRMRDVVGHMLEVGWEVNHTYIEKVIKSDYPEYDSNDQDHLARLMWGRLEDKYHLISNCRKYTAKITTYSLTVWRKTPIWKELADFNIEDVKLIENGIKNDICKIILDNPKSEKNNNEWASLEIHEGLYGWQSKKISASEQ